MKRATLALYVLFGLGALAAGVVGMFSPGLALPKSELTGLATHLAQEQGAMFVFIGLMCLWAAKHYEQRRHFHLSLLAFTVLFAGIHLEGYLSGHGAIRYVIANAVPAVLLALTAPWSASRS